MPDLIFPDLIFGSIAAVTALTVTVPKPLQPASAVIDCLDVVGVTVLSWLLMSDATVIFRLLAPTFSPLSPSTSANALSLSGKAYTLTDEYSYGTVTEYSQISLLKSIAVPSIVNVSR